MSIKHERNWSLSIETINQALRMHGLIATIQSNWWKGKTDQNSIVIKKPQRVVLDPQEKTTLET